VADFLIETLTLPSPFGKCVILCNHHEIFIQENYLNFKHETLTLPSYFPKGRGFLIYSRNQTFPSSQRLCDLSSSPSGRERIDVRVHKPFYEKFLHIFKLYSFGFSHGQRSSADF
jgi:hypothetical protein